MKTNLSHFFMVLAAGFALTACDYSNEFTGSYNNVPATMSAYSKNVNKYCISLNLTANGTQIQSFISAQAVYDANDLFAAKSFNTKGAECSANLSQYLVGTRTTQVLNTFETQTTQNVNQSFCQQVFYKAYDYQDTIHFDIKNNTDDQVVGTFEGKGKRATYTDDSHPTHYGQVYQCGPIYPQPYPGYPGNYPPGYPGNPYPGGYPPYPYPGGCPPFPYPCH